MGLVELSTDIDAVLARAELVITATSSPEKIIRPGSLKRGAVVCDISRPSNVSEEVKRSRPMSWLSTGGSWKCRAGPTWAGTSAWNPAWPMPAWRKR